MIYDYMTFPMLPFFTLQGGTWHPLSATSINFPLDTLEQSVTSVAKDGENINVMAITRLNVKAK